MLRDVQIQLCEAKLHVGCGHVRLEGWLNADLYETEATDLIFDGQQRWPVGDGALQYVYGSHILEHLRDFRAFFAEAWRCLGDGGHLLLRTPYGGNRAAWADLTHTRVWYAESFACLQPGYGDAIGNPQYDAWPCPFQVEMIDLRLNPRVVPLLRWRWVRRLVLPYVDLCPEAFSELHAHLTALKSHETQTACRVARSGAYVPVRYVVDVPPWGGYAGRLEAVGDGGMHA